MATELRPNWTLSDVDDQIPPANLSQFRWVEQPVPAGDQSATLIRAWGWAQLFPDQSAQYVTFTCWDAFIDGTSLTAGSRQIGDAIRVGAPAIGALEASFVQPFFLQWVDNARTQSGVYMIVYDRATGQGMTVTQSGSVILPIAP